MKRCNGLVINCLLMVGVFKGDTCWPNSSGACGCVDEYVMYFSVLTAQSFCSTGLAYF